MDKFKPLFFEDVLPRLVMSYHKGKLIPFTGAGMSAPKIPAWKGFLKNLSSFIGNDSIVDIDKDYTAQELIQCSEEIVNKLSRKDHAHFADSVKKSLGYIDDVKPLSTAQCTNLAAIWWPLILSTNYDRMLIDQLNLGTTSEDSKILLYGRSKIDCHSLLASLKEPAKTVYWALQGFFGKSENEEDLEQEIVVGYRQYRNVTYDNPTFRSVFAEIYRNHSLLFLGTGLSEEYFKGLFGEVLEKFGSNPYTHVALFNHKDIDSIDHQFLHKRFNITAAFYIDENETYDGLAISLNKLEKEIRSKNERLWKLGCSSKNLSSLGNEDCYGLEIITGTMPSPKVRECTVFSAGFQTGLLLSTHGQNYIDKYYSGKQFYDKTIFINGENELVYKYGETDLFAAVAREITKGVSSNDSRNLGIVAKAMEQILNETNGKYDAVNIMLLAAGHGKIFPAVYSFIQMIRGYKRYIKTNELKSTVRIHVVDPSVSFYLRTNSLEIEELLNCDDMMLKIEIQDIDEIERNQVFLNSDKTLASVSEFYDINKDYWQVKIAPTPFKNQTLTTDCERTLEEIGLIPGSMIIYTRI